MTGTSQTNFENEIDDLVRVITEFNNLSVDDEIGFECVAILKDESVRKLPFLRIIIQTHNSRVKKMKFEME